MISVILRISGNPPDRTVNLLHLLRCIKRQTFKDYEIILTEQYEDLPLWSALGAIQAGIKYFSIQGSPLSESWMSNVGAVRSTGDLLVFIDADMVFGDDYFAKVIEAGIQDYAVGWDRLYRVTAIGKAKYIRHSYEFLLDNFSDADIGRATEPRWGSGCLGGADWFERGFFFEKLGGWNESLVGWGAYDPDIIMRAVALTNERRTFPYTLFHLYHGHKQKQMEESKEAFQWGRGNPLELCDRIKAAGIGRLDRRSRVM